MLENNGISVMVLDESVTMGVGSKTFGLQHVLTLVMRDDEIRNSREMRDKCTIANQRKAK